MDCPECGAPLVTYRLAGREAPVCEQCGHVGIDAEHRGEGGDVESWSDALRRFYGSSDDPTVPVRVDEPSEDLTPPETWDDALRRFEAADAPGTTDGDDSDDDDGGDRSDERDDAGNERAATDPDEGADEPDGGTDERRDDV
jgi:hypothetical protein